jgi:hypothetical protein
MDKNEIHEDHFNHVVRKEGGVPPQENVPPYMNEEDMLLYAAWAYGISKDDIVHRFAIFAFIQSHITSKPIEPTQRAIQKNDQWEKLGDGKYKLSELGLKHYGKFGQLPNKINLEKNYYVFINCKHDKYSVVVDPVDGKLLTYVDDIKMTGVQVYRRLRKDNVQFEKLSTGKPDTILNWIIRSGKYVWKRFTSLNETITAIKQAKNVCVDSHKNKLIEIENIVQSDINSLQLEEEHFEGRETERHSVYHERNPKLRAAAINFHGTKCLACGFDFKKKYGMHGSDYIEVHHLRPISEMKKQEIVDPEKDMTVVCANCHRMIHRKKDKILPIEELKNMIKISADACND